MRSSQFILFLVVLITACASSETQRISSMPSGQGASCAPGLDSPRTKAHVVCVVERVKGQIMNEHQRALRASPSLAGVITYYLKVEPTGRASVLLKSDSIGNDDLAEKVRIILEQEDFGEAGGSVFEMVLPVQLAPL